MPAECSASIATEPRAPRNATSSSSYGQPAPLGAEDHQADLDAVDLQGLGDLAPQRDHGVGRRVGRLVRQRQGVRRPDGRVDPGAARPAGCRSPSDLSSGSGPCQAASLSGPFGASSSQVDRPPLQPEDLRRRLQEPMAQAPAVDQLADGQVHLLHRLVELVLLAVEPAVDRPLEPLAGRPREDQDRHRHHPRHDRPRRRRCSVSNCSPIRSVVPTSITGVEQAGQQACQDVRACPDCRSPPPASACSA